MSYHAWMDETSEVVLFLAYEPYTTNYKIMGGLDGHDLG